MITTQNREQTPYSASSAGNIHNAKDKQNCAANIYIILAAKSADNLAFSCKQDERNRGRAEGYVDAETIAECQIPSFNRCAAETLSHDV